MFAAIPEAVSSQAEHSTSSCSRFQDADKASARVAEIGFLSDTRRLNVAISRARLCFVICGNVSLFADYIKLNMEKKKESRALPEEVTGPSPVTVLRDQQEAQAPLIWKSLIQHYVERGALVCGDLSKLSPMQQSDLLSIMSLSNHETKSPVADTCEAGQAGKNVKQSDEGLTGKRDTSFGVSSTVDDQRTGERGVPGDKDEEAGLKRLDDLAEVGKRAWGASNV